ncbi:MAG: hypothetical protein K2W95_04135 [Candidatus Obscuribacterales bacterium]|nr:hypothetical protein [Candidatus Obscuribacterales bacterium]
MRNIQIPVLLTLLLMCAVPGAIGCDSCGESYSSPWNSLGPFAVAMIALFAMTLSGLDVWETVREYLAAFSLNPKRSD